MFYITTYTRDDHRFTETGQSIDFDSIKRHVDDGYIVCVSYL